METSMCLAIVNKPTAQDAAKAREPAARAAEEAAQDDADGADNSNGTDTETGPGGMGDVRQ